MLLLSVLSLGIAVALWKRTRTVIMEGPDLNSFKSPLDKKIYRQILLPNGLKCLLISDTFAMMHQERYYDDEEEEEEDDDEEENGEEKEEGNNARSRGRGKRSSRLEMTDEDDDDQEDGEDADDEDDDDDDDNDEGLRDAAAAMVVGVGSMYDPPEAQGLAHFLEHMLFMGTKKYPTENAYDAFLSKHGGSDNAFTEMEYTLYHLEIPQEKLFKALDMFAQFFVHPLLLDDAVDRELNSIDSEFQLSKNSDSSRLQQLLCHTSGHTATTHPFATFSWGNLYSLQELPAQQGVNVMQQLRSFYDRYYFARNMGLVVVGAYTLDELQQQVWEHFGDIPARPRETTASSHELVLENPGTWQQTLRSPMLGCGMPLRPSSLHKVYRVVPVRDRHTLSVTWQVPSQIKHWKSKPCDYLSHLLGHEAQGSILSSLKDKGWATGCYAGVGSEGLEFASSHALFTMSVSLTVKGMEHWKEVIQLVYSYIGMLRHYCANKGGLPAWIYEELRLTHQVSYQYGDEESPSDLVERLAERLAPHFLCPPDRLLDGSDLLFEEDPVAIRDLLDNFLKPDNGRIDLMSSKFGRASDLDSSPPPEENGDCETQNDPVDDDNFEAETAGIPLVEPHFGTRYWCRTLPCATMEAWTRAWQPELPPKELSLALPPQNPFIPTKLELKQLPADDGHHPLLHASLKLCITVGKRKSWFPATMVKFDGTKNRALLSYEDEEEKWHRLGEDPAALTSAKPGFEGTLDSKIKYRVVALAKDGENAVLKYGDETDYQVEDGETFPPIPPALAENRLPKLICNTQVLKLWHLQDRKFKRPIAELRLRCLCAAANKTPLHRACADLFVKLCADAVSEVCYLASVCDLESVLSSSDVGFALRVNGFDDKLLELFRTIFKVILSFRGRSSSDGLPSTVREARFDDCMEILQRSYENDCIKASKLCTDVRIRCLRATTWSSFAKAQALSNLTKESFVGVMAEILAKMGVEALYHGNVDASDATHAKDIILDMLNASPGAGLPKKKYPTQPVVKIPEGSDPPVVVCPAKDPSEPNSAVELYFQVGKDNVVERVLTDVLSQIMYEPLYDQIRTRGTYSCGILIACMDPQKPATDQFGYSVDCDSRWTCGVTGLYFGVVSATKSAAEITERIQKFIVDFRQQLVDMPQKEFMEHLIGLAKNKLDMFNSLSEECGFYWGEIRDGRLDWNVNRNEVLALRNLTKERVLEAYDDWLLLPKSGAPSRQRAFIVQVVGSNETTIDSSENTDLVGARVDQIVDGFHKKFGRNNWGKIV